jgi:hypothetical protein
VAEEKFDLLQVAAILSAQLRAGPPQIVRPEVLDPDLFCGGLDCSFRNYLGSGSLLGSGSTLVQAHRFPVILEDG